jgi:hypothetical protein
MKRFFAVLFAALIFTPAAYAVKAVVVENIRDEMILSAPSRDADKKTRDALLESARLRGWKVVEDTPPVLQLRLDVRDTHAIVVNVTIKGDKVDVDYVDSVNMRYRKVGDGREFIHPSYNRWIVNLLSTARASAVSGG